MSDKIKTVNRTIHPDTHDSQNSYRVKIGKRNFYDKLIVNINHEKLDFNETYIFDGEVIKDYESIHFKSTEMKNTVQIQWVQNLNFTKL
jgi:hypothetical protein